LKHFSDIDLSQFPKDPELKVTSMLTDRQIWIGTFLIFIVFLILTAFIALVTNLMQH